MNKKNLFSAFAVAAFAVAMTSCDNSPKQDAEPVAAQTNPTELKIAYVEVDSIMSQYQFCKDNSIILQKKSQNVQNTLQQKAGALQAAAANFQQKLQQNAYTEQQARQIQAGLQKQQADLEALQSVSEVNCRQRMKNSTLLFMILSRTSSTFIIRTRNSLLSSLRQATTSSMLTRLMTSLSR